MNRALLSGWSKLVGSNVATGLLQVAVFAVAARALDLVVLGLLVLIQSYSRVVDGLFNFQSVNVLTRFLAEAQSQHDRPRFAGLLKAGLLIDSATAIMAAIIAVLALPFLAQMLEITDAWLGLAMLFCLVIVTRISGSAEAGLRCFDRFWLIGLRPAAGSAIALIASLIAWYEGAEAATFLHIWLWSEVAANLGFLLLSYGFLRRETGLSVLGADASGAVRQSKRFWPMMVQTNATFAVRMVVQDGDVLAAGALLGPAPAALLRAGKQFSSALNQLGRPLQQAASAPLSRLAADGDVRGMVSQAAKIAGIAALAGTVVALAMVLLAGPVLTLLFGPEFEAASTVTILLFFGFAAYLAGVTLLPAMLAIDRSGRMLFIMVLATLIFVIAAGLTLPMGIIAFGIAHIAFHLAYAMIGWVELVRGARQKAVDDQAGLA